MIVRAENKLYRFLIGNINEKKGRKTLFTFMIFASKPIIDCRAEYHEKQYIILDRSI